MTQTGQREAGVANKAESLSLSCMDTCICEKKNEEGLLFHQQQLRVHLEGKLQCARLASPALCAHDATRQHKSVVSSLCAYLSG